MRALSTFLGFSIHAEGEGVALSLAVSHTSVSLSDERSASFLAASPFSLLSHSCLPLLCSLLQALWAYKQVTRVPPPLHISFPLERVLGWFNFFLHLIDHLELMKGLEWMKQMV